MKLPLYLLIAVIVTGCSSAAKVRRAKRLLESSGVNWQTDTVYQDIQVMVPQVRVDTFLRHVNFTDTITVIRDKVVTKVKVNTVEHTVYVYTDCPERIVTKLVPVIVNKEIKVSDGRWKNITDGLTGAGILLLVLILLFVWSRFKNWI